MKLLQRRLALLFIFFLPAVAMAQISLKGTVLDNSKINYVEGVRVVSTGGTMAYTDSMGHYSIPVKSTDSVFFVYNNKPTQKFAVASVGNTEQFDISLLVPVVSRYKMLNEVVVHSKNYKQDSIENRETYAKIFDYHKPRVQTSISPGGGVGMDLDELINMFRFRRNKDLKRFQKRLEKEEQEKYIDYRFSKNTVRRVTNLKGQALDTFMVWYRPSYEFVSEASDIAFYQYIINAMYQYRKINPFAKKEED